VTSSPGAASLADAPERLADLPPSAKLAYLVLQEADRELAQSEVAERAALSVRTTRHALGILLSEGLVGKRVDASDLRVRRYQLYSDTSSR
jgi:DNA-binding MarR family transcriptional regulator